MGTILGITAPIYLLMAIGYGVTRAGIFSKADMRVLGRVMLTLALPALLFRAVTSHPLGEILHGGYLLAYSLGSLLVVAGGYGWSRWIGRQDPTSSTIAAMGMACSNSGFIGYPIVLLTYPTVAGVSVALNMMVENLLIIPLLLFWIERARSPLAGVHAIRQAVMTLIKNPFIWALLVGLSVAGLAIPLPTALSRTVDLMANAASALSLLVVGGSLVGVPWRGASQRVAPIMIGKLFLHPLLVLAAATALPLLGVARLSPPLHTSAVLMAAMPMMGLYPTFAQAYGLQEISAVTLLVTTVMSFFTLSGLLWLLLP